MKRFRWRKRRMRWKTASARTRHKCFLSTMKFGSGGNCKNHRGVGQATISISLISAEFPAILHMNTNCARRSNYRRAFFFGAQMTDAEILTLVDRLERCLLAKEDFHH